MHSGRYTHLPYINQSTGIRTRVQEFAQGLILGMVPPRARPRRQRRLAAGFASFRCFRPIWGRQRPLGSRRRRRRRLPTGASCTGKPAAGLRQEGGAPARGLRQADGGDGGRAGGGGRRQHERHPDERFQHIDDSTSGQAVLTL